MNDDRKKITSPSSFSSNDLGYILDVNKKAVEIYFEVERQNDQILTTLNYFKEVYDKLEDEIDIVKDGVFETKELLRDDNNHDHNVIIGMLKDIKDEIVDVKDYVDEKIKDVISFQEKSVKALKDDIEKEIKSKISEIDKNLFRLTVLLGSTGLAVIVSLINSFIHK
jgi:hypothetical protein